MRFTLALCFALSLSLTPLPLLSTPVALAAQARTAPLRVVILPFRNLSRHSEDEWLSDSFAESLTMGLLKVEALQLVERSQLQHLLKEQQFGQSGLVDESSAPRLGKLLGAKVVVLGSFQKVGDQLQAWVRFVDVENGQIDARRSAEVQGRFPDIFALQKQLASGLIQQLQVAAQPAELQEMGQVLDATASPVAYQHYMRGLKLQRAGDSLQLQQAQEAFEAAVAEDPNYVLALSALADLHAQKAFERQRLRVMPPVMIQRGPDDVALAEQYLAQAQAINPRLPQLKRVQARLAVQEGRRQEALRWMQEAVKLDPRDSDSLMYYLNLRFEGGQQPSLKQVQHELLTLGADPNDPWLQFSLGSLGLSQELFKPEPQLAIPRELLESAQQQLPDFAYLPLLLVSLAQRENKAEEAERHYQRALELASDSPELLSSLAAVVLGNEQPERALKLAEQALALQPEGFNPQLARAEAFYALERVEEAEALFTALERRFPDSTLLAFSRASLYFGHGHDFEQARSQFALALQRWERHPDGVPRAMLIYLLGFTELATGHLAEAQAHFETLKQDPVYYGQAYEQLATIYHLQQKHAAALDAYTSFLTISPELREAPRVQQNYRWYYLLNQWDQNPENVALLNDLGQISLERKAPDLAVKYWQQGLTLEPEHPVLLFNLGTLKLHQGEWAEAARLLEAAVAHKPDYLKAWFNLGLALKQQGQKEAAKRAFERVLALDAQHGEARQALQDLTAR
ncbi:MAG: tetratricopeptide repeat protein [Candidatus Sericytochromatia bacterium]